MRSAEFEMGIVLAIVVVVAVTMAPAWIEARRIKKLKKKIVRPYLDDFPDH